ncbi:hypothetical protein CCR75_000319 [Bremia lactucae]|uniref:FAR1 domain-containing protein n=1 Tax=Bremia lactucae TaxID=4779 RepID=A0A976FKM0_BRELC|nr:hypothetical protein CCR75_000319 [Bremia lactucae]
MLLQFVFGGRPWETSNKDFKGVSSEDEDESLEEEEESFLVVEGFFVVFFVSVSEDSESEELLEVFFETGTAFVAAFCFGSSSSDEELESELSLFATGFLDEAGAFFGTSSSSEEESELELELSSFVTVVLTGVAFLAGAASSSDDESELESELSFLVTTFFVGVAFFAGTFSSSSEDEESELDDSCFTTDFVAISFLETAFSSSELESELSESTGFFTAAFATTLFFCGASSLLEDELSLLDAGFTGALVFPFLAMLYDTQGIKRNSKVRNDCRMIKTRKSSSLLVPRHFDAFLVGCAIDVMDRATPDWCGSLSFESIRPPAVHETSMVADERTAADAPTGPLVDEIGKVEPDSVVGEKRAFRDDEDVNAFVHAVPQTSVDDAGDSQDSQATQDDDIHNVVATLKASVGVDMAFDAAASIVPPPEALKMESSTPVQDAVMAAAVASVDPHATANVKFDSKRMARVSFNSWFDFDSYFEIYMQETYQPFRMRSSCSVEAYRRNQQKVMLNNKSSRGRRAEFPDEAIHHHRIYMCTHAMKARCRGANTRPGQKYRGIGCMAKINVKIPPADNPSKYMVIVTDQVVTHNHPVSREIYEAYPDVLLKMMRRSQLSQSMLGHPPPPKFETLQQTQKYERAMNTFQSVAETMARLSDEDYEAQLGQLQRLYTPTTEQAEMV